MTKPDDVHPQRASNTPLSLVTPTAELAIFLHECITTRFNSQHVVVHMQHVFGQVCNC
jgi:hypothetical protein